jgi:hypothetical protein
MAKKFFPATSVSSKSTFSASGRTLDDDRSSLSPSMVEALVCSSSWIQGAHDGIFTYVVCIGTMLFLYCFIILGFFKPLNQITLIIFRSKRTMSKTFHFQNVWWRATRLSFCKFVLCLAS